MRRTRKRRVLGACRWSSPSFGLEWGSLRLLRNLPTAIVDKTTAAKSTCRYYSNIDECIGDFALIEGAAISICSCRLDRLSHCL
jgi:hypothetical protein